MTAKDDHLVQATQISSGLTVLKKRQSKISLLSGGASLLFVLSTISIFVQQDFVYSFFGLTQVVEQLHLPYTVDSAITDFNNQPDYFFNLIAWFGWLILKVILSFTGAFFAIWILKKIRFFYTRFQSFVLKFVAWLIAVIVIWSGLTYVQYDLRDDDHEQQHYLVQYDQSIQQSQIAKLLNETETNSTVKAYVLAQTALLHKPIDKDVATAYVAQLIQAERLQKNFIEYAFKPEQLWVMQHQVYGHSVSPIAQNIDSKVQKANQTSDVIRIIFIALALFSLFLSIVLFILSIRLKRRALKIEQSFN
ncbi:MAG: hypothetical protein H9855_11755 [Candidatus Acinetobacter avistercoris]|uniref:hypothetical protein n=1 Tax=Acinetobacter sp. KS-LM10 TaxID=3120518 RepID=UPI001F8AE039|nr:hypothetical protein [Candidatus Acinetobacter avistercoris]